MKLYSYVVTHDTGFAPNPFWGWCTLATCKPAIRRTADVGDWIVGLSPKASGNRLIFAMEVDEILDYRRYYRDRRFVSKRPDFTKKQVIHKAGDNIYKPLRRGEFQQLRSRHSFKDRENPVMKAHDLGGINVLVANKFHYFGGDGPNLPKRLQELKVGRAHKNRFSQRTISDFLKFIQRYPQGVNGAPTRWPEDDMSWRQRRR